MRLRGPRAAPAYRLLSRLLQYPTPELLAAGAEIEPAIAGTGPAAARARLQEFWTGFRGAPLLELQQRYVEVFDLDRGASLHLTYYSEGDTRRRGSALLAIKRAYAEAGLRLEPGELPDFLPVMLEFAALEPEAGARLLRERRASLEMLRLALRQRESPYALLLEALLAWMPALGVPEREAVERFLRDGAPAESVGLEPFAPAGAMPELEARR